MTRQLIYERRDQPVPGALHPPSTDRGARLEWPRPGRSSQTTSGRACARHRRALRVADVTGQL